MAYSTDNPPRLIAQSKGAGPGPTATDQTPLSGALWMYISADANATIVVDTYVSNAVALGMKVGDVVIISDTTTPLSTTAVVETLNADGSADLT